MRRLLALPITAFLALLLTGTVAAGGPNVQNISGGATIAQADWETSDVNGGYTSGYAAASVEQGQSAAYLEFSQQSVTWVLCSDAGTPNDAGAPDGGTPDGGMKPGTIKGGCGCSTSPVPLMWLLLLPLTGRRWRPTGGRMRADA